jgi:hypothetical protein
MVRTSSAVSCVGVVRGQLMRSSSWQARSSRFQGVVPRRRKAENAQHHCEAAESSALVRLRPGSWLLLRLLECGSRPSALSSVTTARGPRRSQLSAIDLGRPSLRVGARCLLRRPARAVGDRTLVGGRTWLHSSPESARTHKPVIHWKQSDFMRVAIARAQLHDVLMRSSAASRRVVNFFRARVDPRAGRSSPRCTPQPRRPRCVS